MAGALVQEAVRLAPADALRPFVAGYTGYRHEGLAPGSHQGLPSPHLTIVISFDDALQLTVLPDGRPVPASFDAMVAGLHDTPATIVHDGCQHGMQLDVSPLGARALLGLPAAELAGTAVHLDDLFGRRAPLLQQRLQEAESWEARRGVLDAELAARLGGSSGIRPEVGWAWQRLLATGGTVEVGRLAAEVGWSARHLNECFRAEFGVPPKRAARIVRFHRARKALERSPGMGLAAVAAECGYADQAHLTREFRAIAGLTPTAWLGDELRAAQADAGRSTPTSDRLQEEPRDVDEVVGRRFRAADAHPHLPAGADPHDRAVGEQLAGAVPVDR
jgi:AraC-like DNA-binding protein